MEKTDKCGTEGTSVNPVLFINHSVEWGQSEEPVFLRVITEIIIFFLFLETVRVEGWFGLDYVPPCCSDSSINVLLGNTISTGLALVQDIINYIWQYLFRSEIFTTSTR